MKLKSLIIIPTLMIVAGCSEIEQARFLGTYSQWYAGLEASTVQDVSYTYNEHLIESIRVECEYYVKLIDGSQLKFNQTYDAKVTSCKYKVGDEVNVEVHEDNFGNKEYQLVGIK